jgi:hypothetical protein
MIAHRTHTIHSEIYVALRNITHSELPQIYIAFFQMLYWNTTKVKLDIMIETQNCFIHTYHNCIYTEYTRNLTLVGSVGPCRTNKVDLKETYRMKDLITHINSMNYNLYH